MAKTTPGAGSAKPAPDAAPGAGAEQEQPEHTPEQLRAQITALAKENADLRADNAGMKTEISNRGLKIQELESLAGSQRRELDEKDDMLERQVPGAEQFEYPTCVYAMKPGHDDPSVPDSYDSDVAEDEEHFLRIRERDPSRRWVPDTRLL